MIAVIWSHTSIPTHFSKECPLRLSHCHMYSSGQSWSGAAKFWVVWLIQVKCSYKGDVLPRNVQRHHMSTWHTMFVWKVQKVVWLSYRTSHSATEQGVNFPSSWKAIIASYTPSWNLMQQMASSLPSFSCLPSKHLHPQHVQFINTSDIQPFW